MSARRLTPTDVQRFLHEKGDMTREMLADGLGTNKQTIRYHLRSLIHAGLVAIVRTTGTHASEKKWYGIPRVALPALTRNDVLSGRLRAAAELEMQAILDLWGPWTTRRDAHPLLEEVDRRVRLLESHEQAAIAVEHNGMLVWRFARVNRAEAYRSGLNGLLEERAPQKGAA